MDERVICLQGGGRTSSGQQGGDGWSAGVAAYTLNTVDVHGVCYGLSRSFIKGGENSGGMPIEEEKQPTITANGPGALCYDASSIAVIDHSRRHNYQILEKVPTMEAHMGTGGGNVPIILIGFDAFQHHNWRQSETLGTLTTHQVSIRGDTPLILQKKEEPMETYPQITGALCANSHPGSYTGQDAFNDMLPVVKMEGTKLGDNDDGRKYILRRLTPVECARLQGFPDWWTDGADGSDSAVYKMWGNGIALPCAADVIGRLAKELEKTAEVIT